MSEADLATALAIARRNGYDLAPLKRNRGQPG